jgi:hypothetical protein
MLVPAMWRNLARDEMNLKRLDFRSELRVAVTTDSRAGHAFPANPHREGAAPHMSESRRNTAPGKSGRTQSNSDDPVELLLAQLECMGIDDLRVLWKKRFRHKLPAVSSPDILRRLSAWKLQVEAYGDLDSETYTRLRTLVLSDAKRKNKSASSLPMVNLKAGTVLVREWRGVEHRVLVLGKGFEYRDRRFHSLSEVARHISGTYVSGPRFFGLEASQLKATVGSGVTS